MLYDIPNTIYDDDNDQGRDDMEDCIMIGIQSSDNPNQTPNMMIIAIMIIIIMTITIMMIKILIMIKIGTIWRIAL